MKEKRLGKRPERQRREAFIWLSGHESGIPGEKGPVQVGPQKTGSINLAAGREVRDGASGLGGAPRILIIMVIVTALATLCASHTQ